MAPRASHQFFRQLEARCASLRSAALRTLVTGNYALQTTNSKLPTKRKMAPMRFELTTTRLSVEHSNAQHISLFA